MGVREQTEGEIKKLMGNVKACQNKLLFKWKKK